MKKLTLSLVTLVSGMVLPQNSYAQDGGISLQITTPAPKTTVLPISDQISNDFNTAVQKLCAAQGRQCSPINLKGDSKGSFRVWAGNDNQPVNTPVKDACNLGTIVINKTTSVGLSDNGNCINSIITSPYRVCVDSNSTNTVQEYKLTTTPNMSLALTSEPTQSFSEVVSLTVQTEGANYIPLGKFALSGTVNSSVGKDNVAVQTVSITSIVPAN